MTQLLDVPRGLNGVSVTDTTVGDVRGEAGYYHYRQYSAVELARTQTFEDVWALMIDGSLPTDDRFRAEVRAMRMPKPAVLATLPAIVAAVPEADDQLRAALALHAGSWRLPSNIGRPSDDLRRDTMAMTAAVPTLAAALERTRRGLPFVPARDDLGHGANYLWMIHGAAPSAEHAQAVENYLVLALDHGFNNSTFTARTVTSSGADVGAAMLAAFGALSGPRHGGAISRSLDVLDEASDLADIERLVRQRLAAGERIMGFGHPVYRARDPRNERLREVALGLDAPRVALAVAAEPLIEDEVNRGRSDRRLTANIEYYAGVVLEAAGVPRDLFLATFAVARTAGWSAHILEQAGDSKIIRPSARYCGTLPEV